MTVADDPKNNFFVGMNPLPRISRSGMADTKYAPAPSEPPPSYETAAQPTPPKPAPLRAPLPLDLPVINSIRGKRCILASASPRRKQLLSQVNTPIIHITTLESFRLTPPRHSDRPHKPRNHTFTFTRRFTQVPLPL